MRCSAERKKTSQLTFWGKAAYYGNQVLSLLTILIMVIGGAYCVYCLYDDWRQAQGGLPSEMAKYKPDADDPKSFDELLRINPDVIGWITIDDTHIDQPVVQGEDDMEYINKGADGSHTLAGAIFLAAVNKPEFSDPYNILYGHHMDNHGMFGDVMEFVNKSYFDAHKTGSLLTKDFKEYELDTFAVVETNSTDNHLYSLSEIEDGKTTELISYLKENARYFREPETDSPKVFALSTCNDAMSEGRTILYCYARKVVEH